MAVPTYDKFMLPLLQYAGDGQAHHVGEGRSALANYFQLSEEEMAELVPSGKKTKFYDRFHWAKTYLTQAALLESTGRGYFQITQRGLHVLSQNPTHIDSDYLEQFSEFVAFKTRSNATIDVTEPAMTSDKEQTPDDTFRIAYQQLQATLADDLLEAVLAQSSAFFEKLVINLLQAMGYGSSLDSGRQTRLSGDEGIDGYIEEDKLGLDVIYIQAKRWDRGNIVGRPAVQGFVGSLVGAGAKKGVFITTSDFSSGALDYARGVKDLKIILINGEQLAKLMIEHGVGVSVKTTYVIKQIDENYFPEI